MAEQGARVLTTMRRLDLEVGGAPLEAVPELGLELGLCADEGRLSFATVTRFSVGILRTNENAGGRMPEGPRLSRPRPARARPRLRDRGPPRQADYGMRLLSNVFA